MKRCADSNIWSRCTHRSGQFANLLSWIPQPRKQAARIILFQLVRMLNLHASDVNRCLSRSACLWPAPAIVVLEEPWLKDFLRCNSWCPIRLRAGTVGNHVVHHARTLPFSACHCHSSGCQQPRSSKLQPTVHQLGHRARLDRSWSPTRLLPNSVTLPYLPKTAPPAVCQAPIRHAPRAGRHDLAIEL